MAAIGEFIRNYAVIYGLISVLNALAIAAGCACMTAALFRVRFRKNILFLLAALLLCAGTGLSRSLLMGAADGPGLIWTGATFLLPFLCAFLLYAREDARKALLVAAGYTLVEAVKYVLLIVVYRYDGTNPDDPLELAVEFVVDATFFLAAAGTLAILARKRVYPFELSGVSPTLFLLICLTVGVFVTSLVLFGGRSDREKDIEFGFVLLNIPLFTATIAYSVSTIVKAKVREENYKNRLDMQVRHYEMIQRMDEEMRIFRHDLPKKLRPVAAYIDNGEPERAKELVQKLGGFEQSDGTRFHTGNAALDTVLFCEDQLARQSGSRIVFPFGGVFPAEGIDADDIYTIFPNALDNAIDACKKTGKPCEITVSSKIIGDTVWISIKNPVSQTVAVRNGAPVTSSRDRSSHGYGFKSIQKAASKYGEDNVEFSVSDGVFELMMSLKY
ncbi:MAG: GHKL domain-containing protein [Clostridia bacterium]|nr:GHKL domain-containing protein [Clostridia bacterium]